MNSIGASTTTDPTTGQSYTDFYGGFQHDQRVGRGVVADGAYNTVLSEAYMVLPAGVIWGTSNTTLNSVWGPALVNGSTAVWGSTVPWGSTALWGSSEPSGSTALWGSNYVGEN